MICLCLFNVQDEIVDVDEALNEGVLNGMPIPNGQPDFNMTDPTFVSPEHQKLHHDVNGQSFFCMFQDQDTSFGSGGLPAGFDASDGLDNDPIPLGDEVSHGHCTPNSNMETLTPQPPMPAPDPNRVTGKIHGPLKSNVGLNNHFRETRWPKGRWWTSWRKWRKSSSSDCDSGIHRAALRKTNSEPAGPTKSRIWRQLQDSTWSPIHDLNVQNSCVECVNCVNNNI